jgi:hypothetical protein
MRARMRIVLPLVQVVIAFALTMPSYLKPDLLEYPSKKKLGLQWGFALNAPATVSRYFLQRLALQFCPDKYMTGTWTGCYPLPFVFETFVYFAFVWFLWRIVLLEISGRGQSLLTTRTRIRKLADALAIVFGALVAFFGIVISNQMGPGWHAALVGITYLLWAVTIIVFYGHDLWYASIGARRVLKAGEL